MVIKYDYKNNLGTIVAELYKNQNPREGSKWTSFEFKCSDGNAYSFKDFAQFLESLKARNGTVAEIYFNNCGTRIVIDRKKREIEYQGAATSHQITSVLQQYCTEKP